MALWANPDGTLACNADGHLIDDVLSAFQECCCPPFDCVDGTDNCARAADTLYVTFADLPGPWNPWWMNRTHELDRIDPPPATPLDCMWYKMWNDLNYPSTNMELRVYVQANVETRAGTDWGCIIGVVVWVETWVNGVQNNSKVWQTSSATDIPIYWPDAPLGTFSSQVGDGSTAVVSDF